MLRHDSNTEASCPDLRGTGPRRRAETPVTAFPLTAEDILESFCLPRTNGGRAPIRERMVRPIAAIPDWDKQRRMWGELM